MPGYGPSDEYPERDMSLVGNTGIFTGIFNVMPHRKRRHVDRSDLEENSGLRSFFFWSAQLPFPRVFIPKAIVFCWLLANSYCGE